MRRVWNQIGALWFEMRVAEGKVDWLGPVPLIRRSPVEVKIHQPTTAAPLEDLGPGYQYGPVVVYGWLAGCLIRSEYGEYRDMWE